MAAYLVGAIILIYGIFQIAGGAKVYKTSKGKGILSIVCGVLSVIVSIISFTHPVLTMISAGYMIAFTRAVKLCCLTGSESSIMKNKTKGGKIS